jgi:deoxyribonuclease IV
MPKHAVLGAHESIAGGLHLALQRAVEHRAGAAQIFTKNARGWGAKALQKSDITPFRSRLESSGLAVVAHASYLINLAAEPGEIREKGLTALADELLRCDLLGVPHLIVHPGSNPDGPHGLALCIAGILEVFRRTPESTTRLLLENTAGQGNSIGHRIDDLAQLQTLLRTEGAWTERRIGFCLDTCHLFAAGYDLSTASGYDATLSEVEAAVGVARVFALHLNDSKGPRGGRLDRHEDIGKGQMGTLGFEALVNDPRFGGIPAVLETEDGHQEANLATLRLLVRS